MFKLANPKATYNRTVEVALPNEKGDTTNAYFAVKFKLLNLSEATALSNTKSVIEYIKDVVVGWDDVQDAEGKALAFNKKNLDMLCDIGYWARAVYEDHNAFIAGAPEKNSSKLSATL